jgi:hypothetical protein
MRAKLCKRLIDITTEIPSAVELDPVRMYEAVSRWADAGRPGKSAPPMALTEWFNDLHDHNLAERACSVSLTKEPTTDSAISSSPSQDHETHRGTLAPLAESPGTTIRIVRP